MPGMTVSDLSSALGGIISALNTLASGLSTCNMEVDLDQTEGKKVICQIPIMGGSDCRLSTLKEPRVADIHEAVTALAAWAADIQASLSEHSSSEMIFPPGDEIENA